MTGFINPKIAANTAVIESPSPLRSLLLKIDPYHHQANRGALAIRNGGPTLRIQSNFGILRIVRDFAKVIEQTLRNGFFFFDDLPASF